MNVPTNLFSPFGGTRPMARKLGLTASRGASWKRARRVPAGEMQELVILRGGELGLEISAEDVMWPPEDRPSS